jgi:hypothetical protein
MAIPLEPPREPITGDSHRHLLARSRTSRPSSGFTVRYLRLEGPADGWCDRGRAEIVVREGLPANPKCGVLVHELAYAVGVGYDAFGRA